MIRCLFSHFSFWVTFSFSSQVSWPDQVINFWLFYYPSIIFNTFDRTRGILGSYKISLYHYRWGRGLEGVNSVLRDKWTAPSSTYISPFFETHIYEPLPLSIYHHSLPLFIHPLSLHLSICPSIVTFSLFCLMLAEKFLISNYLDEQVKQTVANSGAPFYQQYYYQLCIQYSKLKIYMYILSCDCILKLHIIAPE